MIFPQPVDRYLVLRPLVKYANDERNHCLYIRVGNRVLKMPGGNGAKLTQKILDLARMKCKLGEVIAALPFFSPQEIFRMIDRLVAYGCVEIVDDEFTPVLDNRFYLEENVVSHLGLSEWTQRKKVAEALSKLVISVISENGFGSGLAAALRRNKFAIAHTIENGFAETENMALLKKADLVIGIGSIDNPDFLPRLNQWALQEDKPFLPVAYTAEGRVFVGPLVERKNNGGCYNCLRLRLQMNNPHPKAEALEVLAKDGEGHASKDQSWSLLNSFVSGLVMLQLAGKLAGFPHTDPPLQVFSLDFSNTAELITSHCLLPMPNCETCLPWVTGEPVKVGGMEKAVDKRLGIINKVSPLTAEGQGPKIYHSVSLSSDLSYLNRYMGVISNSGAGYNKEQAFSAAVGEALERYAASYVDQKRLRLACWKELGGELGHPEQYELFSPEQYRKPGFPYTRFTEQTRVCWMEGTVLSSDEAAWVPASMVYLPYQVVPGEAKITPSISTGLAAGSSFEAAVLTGLYEVVERDAFALTWLRKIPPVEIKNIEAYFPDFYYYYPTGNFLYKAYEVTLDIPLRTVIVIIEELTNKKILSVGGATRRRLGDALKKALLEAAQGLPYINALLDYYKDWKVKSDFTNVSSFQKHALLYSKYPELRQKAGFLLGNKEELQLREGTCSYSEPENLDWSEEYRSCLDAVKKAGYEVLAVDLTTPDLKRIGVSVVRVIIPGLHGLHGNHTFRFLGGKRLREVPKKMGVPLEGINEFPHPFP